MDSFKRNSLYKQELELVHDTDVGPTRDQRKDA